MKSAPAIVRCGFGIGNRVAAMANGISRHDSIGFVWRENWFCPVGWREIFPDGIPGVEIIDDAPLSFASLMDGKHCEAWDAAGDRARADAAYARIMAAAIGAAAPGLPFALCARFWLMARPDPDHFAAAVAEVAAAHGHRQVFMLADSRRAELAAALRGHGLEPMLPVSRALRNDRDRDAEQIRRYLSDWKTLSAARHIVCTAARGTSVIYPARARGAEITYV